MSDERAGEEPRSAAGASASGDDASNHDKKGSSLAATAPRPRRRWRRRLLWTAGIVFIVGLILRVSLIWVFPWALQRAAAQYGFECRYSDLDLTLSGADLELWHLELLPKDGKEPLVHIEYCRADVALLALYAGDLVIRRVEVDGMDVTLERKADGTCPLLDPFLEKSSAPPEPVAAKPPASSAAPPDADVRFRPPLEINAARFQNVRVNYRDEATQPPLAGRVDVHLRLSEIGNLERPVRFNLLVTAPPVLDVFEVDSLVRAEEDTLSAEFTCSMRGLHPGVLEPTLATLGLRPVAGTLTLDSSGRLDLERRVPSKELAALAPAEREKVRGVRGKLTSSGFALKADGEDVAGLEGVEVDIARLTWSLAQIERVLVRGLHATASRSPAGLPRFAGIELLPALPPAHVAPDEAPGIVAEAQPPAGAAPADRPAEPAAAPAAPAPAPALAAGEPSGLLVDALVFEGFRLAFDDQAVPGGKTLALRLDNLQAGPFALGASAPPPPIDFVVSLAAPELIETLRVSGQVLQDGAALRAHAELVASDITLAGLLPYLEPSGITPELRSGSFSSTLDAEVLTEASGASRLAVSISGTRLASDGDVLVIPLVKVDGLRAGGAGGLSIERIEGQGPELRARRDAEGALHILGLRVAPPGPPAASAAAAELPAVAAAPAQGASSGGAMPVSFLPAFPVALERFAWSGVKLRLEDDRIAPAHVLELADAGFELDGLHLDAAATDPVAASFKAWAALPGLVERGEADGSLRIGGRIAALEARASLSNVTLARLDPYLQAAGAASDLQAGSLELRTTLRAELDGSSLDAAGAIEGVTWKDGETELLGLDALRIAGVRVAPDALRVGSIDVLHPRALARRDRQGALRIAGIRIGPVQGALPVDAGRESPPAAAPAAPPASAAASSDPGIPPPSASPASSPAGSGGSLTLGRLSIEDVAFRWLDDAATPAVDLQLASAASLRDLTVGGEPPAARVTALAKLDGVLGSLRVDGGLTLGSATQKVELTFDGAGLRLDGLRSYLPPGVEPGLQDGRLHARLEAESRTLAEGGSAVRAAFESFDLRDGPEGEPLLQVGSARVVASRVQPEAQALELAEVVLEGVRARARRAPDGAMEAFGIRLAPVSRPEPTAPTPGDAAPEAGGAAAKGAAAPLSREDAVTAAGAAGAKRAERLADRVARLRAGQLLVKLARLDLGVESFLFEDRATEGSAPLKVEGLRLTNREPIEMLGEDPAALPPLKLRLAGAISPVLGSLRLDLDVHPFVNDPTLEASVTLAGVRGKGITELLPGLAQTLDGSALEDGRFDLHADATLKLGRRDPLDFSLTRDLGLDVQVDKTAFRASEGGPVELGFDSLVVNVESISPTTGDVRVKLIELQKPRARARLEEAGARALGLLVKLPGGAGGEAAAAGAEPARAEPDAARGAGAAPVAAGEEAREVAAAPSITAAGATPTRPAAAGPILVIDRVLVSGIDVLLEDLASTPPAKIPLTGLEVDVRGLHSRALVERHELRFFVSLEGGAVPLPKRVIQNFLLGAVSDAASLVSGGPKEELEERRLFEEIGASGSLALYPALDGRVKASIAAFELAAVRGPAAGSGITLSDGVVDLAADLRFHKGALEATTRTTLTNLELSEPKDGPIYRYLRLPAPLDAVIFALRDAEGSIVIPLSIDVGADGGLSGPGVAAAAASTLTSMIARAVASAPLRVASLATDFVPNPFGGGEAAPAEQVVEVAFQPGETFVPREALRQELEPILARIRAGEMIEIRLSHQLGAGDLERAAVLANPRPEDCSDLAEGLSAKLEDLARARKEAEAAARVAYGAGLLDSVEPSTERLRRIEREIGQTELALDHLYDLMRPGAERQSQRRTQRASLSIARARLAEVDAALRSLGPGGIGRHMGRAARPAFQVDSRTPGGRVIIRAQLKKELPGDQEGGKEEGAAGAVAAVSPGA